MQKQLANITLLGSLLFMLSTVSVAQQLNVPLNRDVYLKLEEGFKFDDDEIIHTGMKPYLGSKIGQQYVDRVFADTNKYKYEFTDWLCRRHAFTIDKPDLYATIDPLFNLQLGFDFMDTLSRRYTTNTRGFIVQANLTDKLSFSSSFYENQAFFPEYMNNYIKERGEYTFAGANGAYQVGFGMIPGQGRAKNFKTWGWDYAMASGYVSFTPNENLNIQFGHDKHFIGEGYRSLLLSDNAFNYPFLKFTASFLKNKIQYTSLHTSMQTLYRLRESTTPEATFEKKGGTFHYLSYYANKYLQFGLFEGVIWQRMDSLTGSLPFNYSSLIPVIGSGTALNGLSSNNNVVLGLNLKVRPHKKVVTYAQFALDDLKTDKFGYQVGVRWEDAFGLENLHTQFEYNSVKPYTYSHRWSMQNYAHYSAPLAHPMGSGFDEIVGIVNYRKNRWFGQVKLNFAFYDDYGDIDYGKDIFLPDLDYRPTGTAENPMLSYQDVKVGFLINPNTHMNLYGGFTSRWVSTEPNETGTLFLQFGFRTSLTNVYYDF